MAYDWREDADRTYRRHLRPVDEHTDAAEQERWAEQASATWRALLGSAAAGALVWLLLWLCWQWSQR